MAEVDDGLAAADAAALFRVLQRRGAIAGDPGPLPMLRCVATPFRGVEFVRAPAAGVVTYRQPLGAAVAAGSVIAEIIDPDADDPARARTPVRTTATGRFFARRLNKLVRPDDMIAKVASAEPLAEPNHY